MNPLELVKLLQTSGLSEREQQEALAAMGEAPGEDYQPEMQLPHMNSIPAFRLGDGSMGSLLAGQDYGVAAPVLGQEQSFTPNETVGQLLVGDSHGSG